jgi:hypothetical protein
MRWNPRADLRSTACSSLAELLSAVVLAAQFEDAMAKL